MIDPRALEQLSLSQLEGVKSYLEMLQVPEHYTPGLTDHQLYIFLAASPEIDEQTIISILQREQPPEIIGLLLRDYPQRVTAYLLSNPANNNLWVMLSAASKFITKQQLRTLFIIYFDPLPYIKSLEVEVRDECQPSIRKKIFFAIKDAIKSNRLHHKQAVSAFEEVYLREPAKQSSVEDSLKLIEMLFAKYTYRNTGLLESSARLRNDIVAGMLDSSSPFAALLSINIYGEMCKLFQSNAEYTQTFIDLYNTLGSYGVHLIKDVWGTISQLVNNKPQLNYLSADKLLEVLIVRVWKHKNDNVPKHCVRDFLKSSSIDRLAFLRGFSEVAYNTLTQMLNSGQFYLDAPLLMDSSFYRYVSQFFTEAYAKMPQDELTRHLKLFLESVCRWIDYDQALPAFLFVFKQLKQQTRFYGPHEIRLTIDLIRKVYFNLHVRKRWQVVDCLLECLRHLSPEVTHEDLFLLIEAIPEEAYRWNFIHDSDVLNEPGELLTKYNARYIGDKHRPIHDAFLIRERLECALRHISNDGALQRSQLILNEQSFSEFSKVELYYKVLFILQMPYPNLDELIEELARSCYSNPIKMRLTIRHLQMQLLRPLKQRSYPPNQTLSLLSDFVKRCWNEQFFEEEHVVNTVSLVCRHLLRGTGTLSAQMALKAGRKDLAQFTEWVVDSAVNCENPDKFPLMMRLLLVVLKAQCLEPQLEYFMEDCLYDLYSMQLPRLRESKGLKLRVELFLSMVLANDRTFTRNTILDEFLKEPVELIDRYDYKQFPELTVFLKQHYIPYALANGKHQEIDEVQRVLKRSLVSNLEYSMQKNEILSYTDFIFDERLLCDATLLRDGIVNSWVADSLKIGKDSLVIKRPVIDSVYQAIVNNYQKLLDEHLLSRMAGVVLQMARLQEYRGFDGEVLFFEEEQTCADMIALRMRIPPMAEYYGSYPRFLFMHLIDCIVRKSKLYPEQEALLETIVKTVISESIVDDSANKMMFTAPFRLKLRSWQLMQLIVPFVCGSNSLLDWIFERLDKLLEQSNQPQIRYYTELFATRVLLNHPQRGLQFVMPKLKESGNSLNNSITYVIIAGLLLEKCFSREIYNVLLTYICANTAYLRGLAQYFCFYNFQRLQAELKHSWVIQGLYQQYTGNPDSVRLVSRLDVLLKDYRNKLNNWSFGHFCSLPIHKTGETLEEYHMESLKKIGLDIVQQIKEQDEEFLTFKEIWKREAVLPKHLLEQPSQPKSFQRKIDPILEDVYDYNDKVAARTKLRILASNLNQLDNCGHLVRTGEIFSVEELAIHDISILEDEQFRSVSCTGEKWLNIKQVRREDALKYVEGCLKEGYEVVVVLRSQEREARRLSASIPFKCLLVVGNDDNYLESIYRELSTLKIYLGRDLSVHVEVAIFIWEYIKQHLLAH